MDFLVFGLFCKMTQMSFWPFVDGLMEIQALFNSDFFNLIKN